MEKAEKKAETLLKKYNAYRTRAAAVRFFNAVMLNKPTEIAQAFFSLHSKQQ